MRRLWRDEKTTFAGRYYQVTGSPRVAPEPVSPTLLVGGGGPRAMSLAGRIADIASMIPRQDTGEWSLPASLADSTIDRMAEKSRWVRAAAAAAGRDPASVELNTMGFKLAVGPDAAGRPGAPGRGVGIGGAGLRGPALLPDGRAPGGGGTVPPHLAPRR